jgi:hypothetical protein
MRTADLSSPELGVFERLAPFLSGRDSLRLAHRLRVAQDTPAALERRKLTIAALERLQADLDADFSVHESPAERAALNALWKLVRDEIVAAKEGHRAA